MTRIRHVAVVVPARDEEVRIVPCLESVRSAVTELQYVRHRPTSVSITVVADGCTDATVARARRVDGVTVLEQAALGVGAARGRGVASALAPLDAEPRDVWIANTDADSRVPRGWLVHQLADAANGADVVVGTVRPDFAELTDAQIRAWTAAHDPGRPNGHVHGANLGLRASVYAAAGGFAAIAEHEDVDLVRRASELGACVVASDRGEVVTSGRQQGRTPGGYARYLRVDLLARTMVNP